MRVNFYVLNVPSREKVFTFICHLLEQSHQNKQYIYVHVDSQKRAEHLDGLLWTYRDDSFLPHGLCYESTTTFPIAIGFDQEKPASIYQILLNLSNKIPNFYHDFEMIYEFVTADSTEQAQAREKYRQYRNAGQLIDTYKVSTHQQGFNIELQTKQNA